MSYKQYLNWLLLSCFISFTHAKSDVRYTLGIEPIIANKNCINTENCVSNNNFEKILFNAFKESASIDLELKVLPIKRLYLSLLKTHEIDFKYPDNPNWNTEQKKATKIYYSLPVRNYIDGTFVHSEHKNLSLEKIQRLGILRGYTAEPYLKASNKFKEKLRYFERPEQLIYSLISKRIDAIYINQDFVESFKNTTEDVIPITLSENLPKVSGKYYISSINHPEIINKMNQLLSTSQLKQ